MSVKTQTMVQRLTLTALIGLMVLAAPAALAYELPTCYGDKKVWGTLTPTFEPANLSFPAGVWHNALNAAQSAWNFETPGTRFRFNFVYTADTTWAEGDGQSTIGFTTEYAWGPTTLGVELTRYKSCIFLIGGGGIKESDIMFNPARPWNTALNPNVPGPFDASFNFGLVAIHELGHGFGFTPHEDDILATMNAFYPNGGVIGGANDVHPHSDDILGNRAGYGTCCTERDLAVSAYERTGAGTSDRINPPFTAFRGHRSSFRFTIENRGTTNEGSVRVQFYLSPDRNITTGDTFLGAATYSLNSGAVATNTASVTVPTSIAPGNYFFGYIIDPLSSIVEVDEGNNSVAHAFSTNVPTASPPIACFSAFPTFGSAPLSVSFNASCSSDPNGSISSYRWVFGDGSTTTTGSPTVSHTYFDSGNFTVTLTVTDNSGQTDTETDFIFVTGGSCIIEPCETPL